VIPLQSQTVGGNFRRLRRDVSTYLPIIGVGTRVTDDPLPWRVPAAARGSVCRCLCRQCARATRARRRRRRSHPRRAGAWTSPCPKRPSRGRPTKRTAMATLCKSHQVTTTSKRTSTARWPRRQTTRTRASAMARTTTARRVCARKSAALAALLRCRRRVSLVRSRPPLATQARKVHPGPRTRADHARRPARRGHGCVCYGLRPLVVSRACHRLP
jgi:hypothetical protein